MEKRSETRRRIATSSHRPFNIGDAMILIAALAVGLALARYGPGEWMGAGSFWSYRIHKFVADPLALVMVAVAMAIIPIRLRRPRPRWLRIMSQPGMAAACAVAIAFVCAALAWSSHAISSPTGWLTNQPFARFWRINSGLIGNAVAGSWLALAIGGRWRPEPSWIDRLGRALGCFWLLEMLCEWPFGRWLYMVLHLTLART